MSCLVDHCFLEPWGGWMAFTGQRTSTLRHMHVLRVFRGTADSVVRPAVRSCSVMQAQGLMYHHTVVVLSGGSKISPPCICVYVIQGRACDTAESDSDRLFSASRRSLKLGVCLPRCFHWSHIESCKFLWDQKFWRQRSQEDNLSYYVWKPVSPNALLWTYLYLGDTVRTTLMYM